MTTLNHHYKISVREIFRGTEGNWTPNKQKLGATEKLCF